MHPRSIRVVILTSVAILTIAALAVFLVPTALAVDAFPDVPDSHWAHDFIKWLFDNGITSGFPDGTYRPDNNVTRAEMAVFVQQVAGAGSAGPVTDADKLDGLDSTAFAQLPIITRLHYSGQNSDSSITATFEQIREVGSFTKVRTSTDLLLDWNAHGRVNGTFCHFQLRVDGKTDNGSASTAAAIASGGHAVLYTADSPIHVTALFPGVTDGDHTVSIWVRGIATSCILNFGNFGQDVLVTELDRITGAGSSLAPFGAPSEIESGEG